MHHTAIDHRQRNLNLRESRGREREQILRENGDIRQQAGAASAV